MGSELAQRRTPDPSHHRRRRAFAGALFAAALVATSATGQTAADRENARRLMDEGFARRGKGDHKGALERFEGADALMHVPTTGVEVARERIALGKLIEAREVLAAVVRFPTKAGEPAPFAVARAAAQRLDEDLAARIPSLRIVITGGDGATNVTVDGDDVPAAALVAPRPVNPGTHVLVARSGTHEKREEVSLKERESKDLTLDLGGAPFVPQRDDPLANHGDGSARRPDEDGHKRDKEKPDTGASPVPRIAMYGGFTVAAVGLAVGSVAGIWSLSAAASGKGGCYTDNKCPPGPWHDIQDARTAGNVSNWGFGIGAAGAIIGVVGLLLSKSEPDTKSAEPKESRVEPWVGLGSAGVSGRF